MNKVNPVMQDSFGEKGTCMTACIATMLSIPFSDVPRFVDLTEHLSNDPKAREILWGELIDEFLRSLGYRLLLCGMESIKSFHAWAKSLHEDYFYMVAGTSNRSSTRMHAVIYKNGEPYHDPNPARTFLIDEFQIMALKRVSDES